MKYIQYRITEDKYICYHILPAWWVWRLFAIEHKLTKFLVFVILVCIIIFDVHVPVPHVDTRNCFDHRRDSLKMYCRCGQRKRKKIFRIGIKPAVQYGYVRYIWCSIHMGVLPFENTKSTRIRSNFENKFLLVDWIQSVMATDHIGNCAFQAITL